MRDRSHHQQAKNSSWCRSPGHGPAGRASEQLIGQYDITPAITDYLGFGDVSLAGAPGRSFAPLLRGQGAGDWPDAVFFAQEETRGVRTGRYSYWKLMPGSGDAVLFDLERDPWQRHDVAGDQTYSDVIVGLDERLTALFARHSDPRYDVWRGGRANGSVIRPGVYQAL